MIHYYAYVISRAANQVPMTMLNAWFLYEISAKKLTLNMDSLNLRTTITLGSVV